MVNFESRLSDLQRDVKAEYDKIGDYNFILEVLKENKFDFEEEELCELNSILQKEDYSQMYEYGLHEYLPDLYYLDSNGMEQMAYLIKNHKDKGLILLKSYSNKVISLDIDCLAGVEDKIKAVEALKRQH